MSINKDDLRKYGKYYDKKKLNILAKTMNKKLGDMAAVIAIEELSELIQITSKWLRFDKSDEQDSYYRAKDKMALTEELADATIALHTLKYMAGISQQDIDQMIAYKIDRKSKFLNNGTIVNR